MNFILEIIQRDFWMIIGITILLFSIIYRMKPKLLVIACAAALQQILIEISHYERDHYFAQIITFLILCVLGFIFLEPVLKKRFGRQVDVKNNPIGEVAFVYKKPLTKESIGEVMWRNNIKHASLSEGSSQDELAVNQKVVIVGVTGAVLDVEPYKDTIKATVQTADA
ncbi:MAG: NfeD family protein [Rickettsiales bacterium]